MGMTEGGRDPFGLDSRFYGNDKKKRGDDPFRHPALDAGSSPSRHPALDAGSSPAWIPVFTGMTEGCGNNGRGAGMTSGTRITTDESSITIKNPTGQAPRYSLFCYLKWLHPCGKPQGMRRLEISGSFA